MKKLLSLLLVLAMFVPAMSALAETELTVWCWDPNFNIYAINEAAKVYAGINPDVKINVVETSSDDCATKQTTALASGQLDSLPDIILVQDNDGRKFLSSFPGSYVETDGKVDLANFASYKLKHFSADGKQYSVPFDNGCAAMFLRTDYLEAAGYTIKDVTDITWDRFFEIGADVKAKTGKPLLVAQAGLKDFISICLQSAGSWYFTPEGEVNIENNAVVKSVVEMLVKMRKSGTVLEAADWSGYVGAMNASEAGGTVQGCWIIGSIVSTPEKEQSGKWGMTNIPKLDCEGATNYSSYGGSSWVVFNSSKNADVAVDFLSQTFGKSVDFYQTILQSTGAIATYLPASTGPAYAEPHPFFNGQKIFEDLMTYSSSIPMVEFGLYNYEARDAVAVAFENVMNGADIDAELKTAQQTVVDMM